MTPQQIKDAAPEGATHYSLFTNTYYKELDRIYVWNGKDWFYSIYKTISGMHSIKPL